MAGNWGNDWAFKGRANENYPAKIKCRVDKIVKPSASFSTKQLDMLQKHMRGNKGFDPVKMGYISCTGCTSQQVVELECCKCDKTMGLDKFTKAQRKNPDNAECIKCVNERLGIEPDGSSDDDDHHGSDDGPVYGSDEDDEHDIQNATASMNNASISTFPSKAGSSDGGVLLSGSTAPTSYQNGSTKNSASTVRTTSAFNATGYKTASSSVKKAGGGNWGKPPKADPRPIPSKKIDSDDEDKELIFDSD